MATRPDDDDATGGHPGVTIGLTVDADAVSDVMTLWYLLHEDDPGLWDPLLCAGLPSRLGFWLGRLDEISGDDDRYGALLGDWSEKQVALIECLLIVADRFLGPDRWRALAEDLGVADLPEKRGTT
jgi:hypothetical protein